MVQLVLGLGSNAEREANLIVALDALQAAFGHLAISPAVESEPHGQPAPAYLNLVALADTGMPPAAVKATLRDIENRCGRRREGRDNGLCPLDVDLLLYGNRISDAGDIPLPHPDVINRAYVLYPLSLLVPSQKHPLLGQTYAALWQATCSADLPELKLAWPVLQQCT